MIRMKPIAAAILTLGTLGSANLAMASTTGGAVDDRIADLERQIAELRALVAGNQQVMMVQEEAISANSASIATNVVDIEEARPMACLLYTSDAADDASSV